MSQNYLDYGRTFKNIQRHLCTGFDPKKIYMIGEKDSGLQPRGPLQNYCDLKEHHLREKTLFEDPQFIPGEIDLPNDIRTEEIKWLRPRNANQRGVEIQTVAGQDLKEIIKEPQFVTGKEDRFDVNQGYLGDCWFLAAFADVTQNRRLLKLLVPTGQSFEDGYAGIFHFRFWQYGRWIDVVIDDKLPTLRGNLIFAKSTDPKEFWSALLEKAYAKLYGSYANLEGGLTSEALGDFTGGLTETYSAPWKFNEISLFDMMLVSFAKKSFMGCAILEQKDGLSDCGLISGHAYSITNVLQIEDKSGNIYKLLRIRNPWGRVEWKGNWSDSSTMWNSLPNDTKEKLLVSKENGEFWMQFEDFCRAYNLLEFCHPNPDFLDNTESNLNYWESLMVDGEWIATTTNGGPPSDQDFFSNPHYQLTLNGKDRNEKHTVKIGLMQKDRRIHREDQVPIGFAIYTFEAFQEREPIYLHPMESVKQVTGHINLPNGRYLLIPFTEEKRESCDYLLRIYSTVTFDFESL